MKREQALQVRDLMPEPPVDWPKETKFEVRLKTRWRGDDCIAVKVWAETESEPAEWTPIGV